MKLQNITNTIRQIIPLELAQPWDNVGLLIGRPDRNINNIMLTIDVTKDVLAEAVRKKIDLIITYHPVIFDGLKKITPAGPAAVVYQLIRAGIAVFAVHTALDVVKGGVNDGLADIIGIKDTKPLGDYVQDPAAQYYKLVVFVPTNACAKVANALFEAGAGHIGNYSRCSFQSTGRGTFRPLAGAHPAIGRQGKTETVPEIRFETIVPEPKLGNVIAAMKNAHPYETPAFDCFRLHNSQPQAGLGRIGLLEKPTPLNEIVKKIKKHTHAKTFGIVGPEKRIVKSAAVCAGACGKIIDNVIAAGTDLYVTGELKHHYALAAKHAGLTCLCLTHSVSERFILRNLAKHLRNHIKNVTISLSKKDSDPFKWKNL